MDSFVRLFAIYRNVTRAWVAKFVYTKASPKWKVAMWTAKATFVAVAVLQFCFTPHWPYYTAVLAAPACAWVFCFNRSRKSAFADQYRLYPERIKYFERDYQYLRYLEFKRRMQQGTYAGDIDDALRFLGEQIETDSQSSIASHPVMTVLLGTLLAVLGAAAGQWPGKYVFFAALGTAVALGLTAMVLGMLRTPQGDLKEFKRFLLWAKHEQGETQPTG